MKTMNANQQLDPRLQLVWSLIKVIVLLYVFLVGVQCLSSGIKGLGKGTMDAYMSADMNPIVGLIVGILATTLVQSSSVTTSLIVGLVASGQLAVAAAVPMVMGANIGTTVTNTIASLAHSARGEEFRRAFAAATCHDFFNYLAVITLLPLELLGRAFMGQGPLEMASGALARNLVGIGGTTYKSPVKALFKMGVKVIKSGLDWLDGPVASIALAVIGGVLIFVALGLIVRVMRSLMMTRVERFVNRFLGSGGLIAMLVGVAVTAAVQSSSITTSIMVPLAGAGVVTLRQVYPITLGANIGTTLTALLAAMAVSGAQAGAAVQVGLVHLLFNLLGIAIWYAPEAGRRVPLMAAERLANVAAKSKKVAVTYVVGMFYGLPAVLFLLSQALG
ncbi:MAG: Na/Pi symporter [Myxococcales bacterium]|nr:Na/Pi symporter [Myxococcales bacterium]